MAPTFRSGRSAEIKIIRGGTTYNLSSGGVDSNMARGAETHDVTTYGDNDRNFIPGLKNGSFTIQGLFATTYEDGINGCVGSTGTTISYGPHGNTAGNVKYTASIIVTSFDVSAPVGDVAKFSLQATRTGALTSTNY